MASSIIAHKQPTQTRLRELLYFNESEGKFYWRIAGRGGGNAGDLAGTVTTNGYSRIRIDGKAYATHRLVFLWVTGEFPKDHIDHINRNPLDNRFENLRVVTHAENHKNRGMSKRNTSGFNGVHFHKKLNKWCATIRIARKSRHLGLFDSIDDAMAARMKANIYYGFSETHGMQI